MLQTLTGSRGMVTAPHHLAAQAGLSVLKDGGNAIEAMVAVTAPRWLLGRTWGQESVTLKLESRIPAELVQGLARAGHDVEVVDAFSDQLGHAGALVFHPNGVIAGATDPRSDGAVAGF